MKRLVIFDLDGTLLDTIGDLARATNHALSAMGFKTHPLGVYPMLVGNGVTKLIERALPEEERSEATIEQTRPHVLPRRALGGRGGTPRGSAYQARPLDSIRNPGGPSYAQSRGALRRRLGSGHGHSFPCMRGIMRSDVGVPLARRAGATPGPNPNAHSPWQCVAHTLTEQSIISS